MYDLSLFCIPVPRRKRSKIGCMQRHSPCMQPIFDLFPPFLAGKGEPKVCDRREQIGEIGK